MELEKGVHRWVVDISKWNPSSKYFSFVMSFLPQHEHSSITRFVKLEDRKRALVSRLLQYALVHQVLGIPFDEIIIRRTVEGKPYLVENLSGVKTCQLTRDCTYGMIQVENDTRISFFDHIMDSDKMTLQFPNFNFNTSHDGQYVAIASEPVFLVGLDIVYLSTPEKESVEQFINNFSAYFSHVEWSDIAKADSSTEMLNRFYRYWCLKEAFTKATGVGMGNRLDNVEFHHVGWKDIFLKVDGKRLKDWRFWLLELGNCHSVAIARGHPRSATTNFMKTLKLTELDDKDCHLRLHLPSVHFMFRIVEDLIPVAYGAAVVYIDKNHVLENEEIVGGQTFPSDSYTEKMKM